MKRYLSLFMLFSSLTHAELESQKVNLNCQPLNQTACPKGSECGTWDNDYAIKYGIEQLRPVGITIDKLKLKGDKPLYFVKWGVAELDATEMGNTLFSYIDGGEMGESSQFAGKQIQFAVDLVTLRHTYEVIDKEDQHKLLQVNYQCSKGTSLFD